MPDKGKQFVRGTIRKAVARPQPPMKDSRTKRARDKSTERRAAIDEAQDDNGD